MQNKNLPYMQFLILSATRDAITFVCSSASISSSSRDSRIRRVFGFFLKVVSLHVSRLMPNEAYQDRSNNQDGEEQDQIHRQRIPIEDFVSHSIQARLREVKQACSQDDETVDLPKSVKAKDLGCVIRHSGVVKWSVEDEEGNVDIGSPCVGEGAQNAEGSSSCNEEGKDKRRAEVIEYESDEWNGKNSASRQSNVKDLIHTFSEQIVVKHVLVLRSYCCDEVVDSRHLDHCEESDENEPG